MDVKENRFSDEIINMLVGRLQKLSTYHILYPQDANFGSFYCEKHTYHFEVAALLLPLIICGQKEQNVHMIEKAVALANWLSARQEPNGSWQYSTELILFYITIALPLLTDYLQPIDKKGLYLTRERAVEWSKKNRSRNLLQLREILCVHLLLYIQQEKGYNVSFMKQTFTKLGMQEAPRNGRTIKALYREIDKTLVRDEECLLSDTYDLFLMTLEAYTFTV